MSIVFTCSMCKEESSVGPEFAGRRGTCAFCGASVLVPQASGEARYLPESARGAPGKSAAFWIVGLVVGVFVLLFCGGLLAGLLLPAIQAAREAGRRAQCMNNLRQVNVALKAYSEGTFRFPPAATTDKNGKPLMSWRVAILPSMGRDDLYRQYDPKQPWNSPKNLELVKQMPKEFHCLSDSDAGEGETSYFMFAGEDTLGGLPGSPGTSPQKITDGLSNTVAIIEVHGLKVPWTEPRDITLDQLIARLRLGGRIAHAASFNVGFANGDVRGLPTSIDAETLRRLAIINDGKPVNFGQF